MCAKKVPNFLSVSRLMPMPEPGFATSFEPVASGLPPRGQKAVVEKEEVSREVARRRTRPLQTELPHRHAAFAVSKVTGSGSALVRAELLRQVRMLM